MKKPTSLLLFICLIVWLFVSSCTQKQNWPQFRGAESSMVSAAKNLPAVWGDDKNIAWKYKLEGGGWSSPVVWGNKIFIVSAFPENVVSETVQPNGTFMSDEEEDEENDSIPPVTTPPPGAPAAQAVPVPEPPRPPRPPENDSSFLKDTYRWEVTCINLNSGKELWKQVAYKGNPKG